MSTNLPITFEDKVNSAELLAYIQQFGEHTYLTSEEINQLRDAINELALPDIFLKTTPITFVDNIATIGANDFIWRLSKLIYENSVSFSANIFPADENHWRNDIIVATSEGTFTKYQGTESEEGAIQITTPVGTLLVATITVFGGSIVGVNVPNLDGYITKKEKGSIQIMGGGQSLSLTDESAFFEIYGFTGSINYVSNQYFRYVGKIYTIKNLTGGNLTFTHDAASSENGKLFFTFPNNTDFVLKANEQIDFRETGNSRLDYIGVIPILINDLTTGGVTIGLSAEMGKALKALIDTKANTLTDINFGAFINGLTPKITPKDADSISIVDSADSNKQKKVSLTIFKVLLKTFFDGIYQDILVSGTNIKTVNGNSLLGSGNLSVIASPYNIRCFYPSWNASVLNTWRSWNRNTSNILVADANQSLGTGTTPGSFADSNFLMINGQNSLTKLTLSIKNSGSAAGVNFEICVQKFDFVNGTQSGMELNKVILINETFTTGNTSLIALKNNFTISSHSLSANSGLFVAYRQTTGTVSPIQGVSLVFEFN